MLPKLGGATDRPASRLKSKKQGEEIGRDYARSCLLGLSALALGPLISGCGNNGKRTYRIGLGPWIGFGPLYLAKEKGYFKDAGLDVELVVLTGLAERNSALKAGKIDALAAPVDYFVLAAGNNLVATIVMAIDESAGGDGIVARKDIQTVADLRGRKVAFQRGLPSEFFLRALLLDAGMSIGDLQTLDMETAQAGAAFIAGQVDAAVVWEPWLTKAAQDGGGHVLASTREFPNLIVDVLAFNQDVVQKHPEDVQAIVGAILKAIDYMLKRWPAFTRFLDNGNICLSNNAAERALRGIAVGRRSWLFAGSDSGGERAAAIYTLIETAKLNNVDPQAWLEDVLRRISDHPARRLTDLLPWNWRAQAVDVAAA
ncbi:MAG: ABC transporter substrate-binding protein [Rhodoplanes sp.]